MAGTKQTELPILGPPANQRTADRLRGFLNVYAKTGSLTGAAKTARISLAIHYQQLEADPEYRKDFEAAQQQVAGSWDLPPLVICAVEAHPVAPCFVHIELSSAGADHFSSTS